MDFITEWQQAIKNYQFPNWNDLPNISLYLDQVLEYTNAFLEVVTIVNDKKEKPMTAAMINNYVKHKIIDAPVKKRYSRQHIAQLIIIGTLKQVLPIQAISFYLHTQATTMSDEAIYNEFISALKQALIPQQYPVFDASNLNQPLTIAAYALTAKIISEYLFTNPQSTQQ